MKKLPSFGVAAFFVFRHDDEDDVERTPGARSTLRRI